LLGAWVAAWAGNAVGTNHTRITSWWQPLAPTFVVFAFELIESALIDARGCVEKN